MNCPGAPQDDIVVAKEDRHCTAVAMAVTTLAEGARFEDLMEYNCSARSAVVAEFLRRRGQRNRRGEEAEKTWLRSVDEASYRYSLSETDPNTGRRHESPFFAAHSS